MTTLFLGFINISPGTCRPTDIVETSDGFRIIQKQPELESLKFPKARKQQISDKIKSRQGTASFSDEEIEQDERLKYILSR